MQRVSESVFEIMQFLIVQRLNKNEDNAKGLIKVLAECRWAIVSAIGIVSILLMFQPQIAGVIQ